MAGKWKSKLKDDEKFTDEDVLEIISERLPDTHEVFEKKGEDYVRMKESGRDLKKMKDSLRSAGLLDDKGLNEDRIKFLAEHKEDFKSLEDAVSERDKKAAGEKTPEMLRIEELQTELKNREKAVAESQKEFEKRLDRARVEGRVQTMLREAANEGIIIDEVFLKEQYTDDNWEALLEKADASHEEFAKLVGERIVKPAHEKQSKTMERLGVSVATRAAGEEEAGLPGGTPGPAGSVFSRGMGRVGEEQQPSVGAEADWGMPLPGVRKP